MRILTFVCALCFDSALATSKSIADSFYDCLIPNYALDVKTTTVSNVVTLAGCRATCIQKGSQCRAFTFQATACKITDEATPRVTWVNPAEQGGSMTWLGDCNCPSSVTTKFPGSNLTSSGTAFHSKHQPLGLQCWPKTDKGKLLQCSLDVLRSTKEGWSGNCLGLTRQTLIPGADCEITCHENPWCSTWQLVTKKQTGEAPGCYQGVGYDCLKGRQSAFKAPSARLQHGQYKLIANMTNYQITGLAKVFGTTAYKSEDRAIQNCREVCYSDLHCQFWQYFNNTGCWVESAPNNMASYPMAVDQSNLQKVNDVSLVAGEYIQHYCLPSNPFNWSTVANGNLAVGQRVYVPLTTLICVLRKGTPLSGDRRLRVFYTLSDEAPSIPTNIAPSGRQFLCNTPTTTTTTTTTTTATTTIVVAKKPSIVTEKMSGSRLLASIGKDTMAQGEWGTIVDRTSVGQFAGLFAVKLTDGRVVHVRPEDLLLREGAPPVTIAPIVPVATTTNQPSQAGAFWFAGILALLLAMLGILVCCCYFNQQEKRPRKKRGMSKPAPAVWTPAPQPVQTAARPLPAVTAPAMVYSAPVPPPATYAAPVVQTYSVPVQHVVPPPALVQPVARQSVATSARLSLARDVSQERHFVTGPATYSTEPTASSASAILTGPAEIPEPMAAPIFSEPLAAAPREVQHYG